MFCRATQDGHVIKDSSDKMWSTGGGNGKPLHYSCLKNPINSMKGWKDMTSKYEPSRSEGVQYATGEEWKTITNSSRKNKAARPKWKQRSVVDVSGGKSKVQYYKEQYYIGTWMLAP